MKKNSFITNYTDAKQLASRARPDDVVDVLLVCPQFIPTEREKKGYNIIKVSGLTRKDIVMLKDTVRDSNGEIIQYRRHKLHFSNLVVKGKYAKNEIKNHVTDRLTGKHPVFDKSK